MYNQRDKAPSDIVGLPEFSCVARVRGLPLPQPMDEEFAYELELEQDRVLD